MKEQTKKVRSMDKTLDGTKEVIWICFINKIF